MSEEEKQRRREFLHPSKQEKLDGEEAPPARDGGSSPDTRCPSPTTPDARPARPPHNPLARPPSRARPGLPLPDAGPTVEAASVAPAHAEGGRQLEGEPAPAAELPEGGTAPEEAAACAAFEKDVQPVRSQPRCGWGG